MIQEPLILEACVESLTEACWAEAQRADQIELCSRLDLDGLTPSVELIRSVIGQLSIPVKVMIRPRAGDFEYSEDEFRAMIRQVQAIRTLAVDHFVVGMTQGGSDLHYEQLERLMSSFPGVLWTIHKAIDTIADPIAAVKRLRAYPSVHSVLTSGQAPTAIVGAPVIRAMIAAAGDELQVIVAGKVTESNLQQVHELIGARAYHGRRIVGKGGGD